MNASFLKTSLLVGTAALVSLGAGWAQSGSVPVLTDKTVGQPKAPAYATIPVVNYAAIKVASRPDDVDVVWLTADDKLNVAFSWTDSGPQASNSVDGFFHIFTWSQGTLAEVLPPTPYVNSTTSTSGQTGSDDYYNPGGLLSQGQWYGAHGHDEWALDQYGFRYTTASSQKGYPDQGGVLGFFGLDVLFGTELTVNDPEAMATVDGPASNGGGVAGGTSLDEAFEYFMGPVGWLDGPLGAAEFSPVLAAYGATVSAPNSADAFQIAVLNDVGWAVGIATSYQQAGNSPEFFPVPYTLSRVAFWGGQSLQESKDLTSFSVADMDNQGHIVGTDYTVNPFGVPVVLPSSQLAEAGVQSLPGLLSAAIQNEVSITHPLLVSNEDANGRYRVLCQTTDSLPAGDTSESYFGVFTYDPTPNATTKQPTGWSYARVVLPANVYVDQIVAMSQDGVLTARGYVDTGDPANNSEDVLLLVPMGVVADEDGTNPGQTDSATPNPPGIVDKDGKLLTSLKVAKMIEDGVITGTGTSATLNVDNDSDRFYVRLFGAANLGITSVKVATIKNPDPSLYNDGPVELTVSADGNDLVTKSLLLTSDDVDDQQPIDGIADNAKNDRTFKIELGGKFQVKSITTMTKDNPPMAVDNPANSEVPIPVQKTIYFTPIILRSYIGKDPVTTIDAAEYQLKVAKERYAQVGINLVWTPVTIKDPPTGANLGLGFSVTTGGSSTGGQPHVSSQAKLIINEYGTPKDNSDIHVFWVNTVNNSFDGEVGIVGGFAIAPFAFTEDDSQYFNNCFVASNQGPFVVAHELGHLLTDDAHDNDPHNVMWGKDQSLINELWGHKRFNEVQGRTMLLLQPPVGIHQ